MPVRPDGDGYFRGNRPAVRFDQPLRWLFTFCPQDAKYSTYLILGQHRPVNGLDLSVEALVLVAEPDDFTVPQVNGLLTHYSTGSASMVVGGSCFSIFNC